MSMFLTPVSHRFEKRGFRSEQHLAQILLSFSDQVKKRQLLSELTAMTNKMPEHHLGTGLMQAILPMPSQPVYPKHVSIQTTLFDLIYAMQAEVEPGEESLITHSIAHLLRSGRVTFCGDSEPWAELLAEMSHCDP